MAEIDEAAATKLAEYWREVGAPGPKNMAIAALAWKARAEAAEAEVARLRAEVERLTPACSTCKGQKTTTPTGNVPCPNCNGTGRAR